MHEGKICKELKVIKIIHLFIHERVLFLLTEEHSEDFVWRRHHQQRGLSGQFDDVSFESRNIELKSYQLFSPIIVI